MTDDDTGPADLELELDGCRVGDVIADAIDSIRDELRGNVVGFVVWIQNPETGMAIGEARAAASRAMLAAAMHEWSHQTMRVAIREGEIPPPPSIN